MRVLRITHNLLPALLRINDDTISRPNEHSLFPGNDLDEWRDRLSQAVNREDRLLLATFGLDKGKLLELLPFVEPHGKIVYPPRFPPSTFRTIAARHLKLDLPVELGDLATEPPLLDAKNDEDQYQ